MTFDEFFEALLQRYEFARAFDDLTPEERSGVRDMAECLIRHFDIGEGNIADSYINGICKIISKNGYFSGLSTIERALCDAGGFLPRKK